MSTTTGTLVSSSIGHWLPKDRADVKKWLAIKLEQFDKKDSVTLDPSIVALQELVAASPYLTKLFSQEMFIQIPLAYVNDPTGKPQVRDFNTMLGLVNMILKEGPQWFHVTDLPHAMGLIGFPINAILDWPKTGVTTLGVSCRRPQNVRGHSIGAFHLT